MASRKPLVSSRKPLVYWVVATLVNWPLSVHTRRKDAFAEEAKRLREGWMSKVIRVVEQPRARGGRRNG